MHLYYMHSVCIHQKVALKPSFKSDGRRGGSKSQKGKWMHLLDMLTLFMHQKGALQSRFKSGEKGGRGG